MRRFPFMKRILFVDESADTVESRCHESRRRDAVRDGDAAAKHNDNDKDNDDEH